LAPPQPVFRFEHPNPVADGVGGASAAVDNARAATLTFERPPEHGAGELHGFAGYFESTLYADVTLSTHPDTHTPGMFSWFPIYFPLREPQRLAAGAPVVARMWRVCAPSRVWYEWAVSAPAASAIHNPGGRSYYVGL
jgi:protein arginine N-methyltransferase 5